MDHRILQTMLTQPTDGTNYSRKEESALVPVSLCSGESSTKRTEDMDAQSSLTQEDVKSKVFFLRQGNSVKLQRQVIRNLKENNHQHCDEFLTRFINWGLFTQKEMCLDPQLLFWCLYCMRTNHAYSLSHSPEALLCAPGKTLTGFEQIFLETCFHLIALNQAFMHKSAQHEATRTLPVVL